MPETRRSFRSNTTPPARTATPRAAAPAPTPAPAPEEKANGGESNFVSVSSFFPSKSGKAETFFVKPDMLEKLADLREGDIVGISQNAKSGRTMLWYIRKS